ncbi:MAG: baseplate J/gp47 family protein [Dehalococcoidia bacterium]|nr:baseplate J/gp47 family protein [Dehalococcoidia bacterium]
MSQVVYAEPSDEMGSLVQKLEAVTETDIVLLVPKHTAFLEDSLHWNLLQRHVRSLGKLVVVVSRDREARHSAHRAGFAVYRSLRRLKFKPSHSETINLRPLLKKGRHSGLPVALGIIGLGVVLFLAISAYLAFPTGSVVLKAASQDVIAAFSVTARLQASGVDLATGQIPARIVQASLDGVDTIDTTGRKSNPAKAKGEVTLLNRTPSPMVVPPSTVLASGQGTLFLTQEQVVLPSSGGTARTSIVASDPGPGGNVPSMGIDRAVFPPFASALAIWNALPTSGGLNEEVGVVSAQDQSNLRSRLGGRLTKEAQDRLQAAKTISDSIYPATVTVSPLKEQFDQELGATASSLTLHMSGAVTGLAFSGEDVNLMARKALEAQMQQGFRLLPETLQVTPQEAYDWGKDWVAFHVQSKAKASAVVDGDQVVADLRGLSPKDAMAHLDRQFPQKDQVSLSVKPLALDWIPVYFWKVEVHY